MVSQCGKVNSNITVEVMWAIYQNKNNTSRSPFQSSVASLYKLEYLPELEQKTKISILVFSLLDV